MKTKQAKPRCSERVTAGGGWHTYQCMKNATVVREVSASINGEAGMVRKDFCKTHDPVVVEERRNKRFQARNDDRAATKARRSAQKADFVARVIEAAQIGGCDDRREAVAAIVEEIVGTGMSWARR